VADHPVRAYYDRAALYYDLSRLPFLLGRRAGVRALDLQPGHRVLEIGAGTGHNITSILSAIGTGSLTLLDFSVGMLRRARNKFSQPSVRYLASDARHMALSGTFDRILFSYSLSLIPDPVAAIQAALPHLSTNGSIVVADFGPMSGWGPARRGIRWWLDKHAVKPVHSLLASIPGTVTTSHACHLGYSSITRIQTPPC
jgi:S-adenosylmethionine-diacylgycerolhomoserine-N-methlytransferase